MPHRIRQLSDDDPLPVGCLLRTSSAVLPSIIKRVARLTRRANRQGQQAALEKVGVRTGVGRAAQQEKQEARRPKISCQGRCGAARVLGPAVLLGMSGTCWGKGAASRLPQFGQSCEVPWQIDAVPSSHCSWHGREAQFGNPSSRQTGRYLVLSIGNCPCLRTADRNSQTYAQRASAPVDDWQSQTVLRGHR